MIHFENCEYGEFFVVAIVSLQGQSRMSRTRCAHTNRKTNATRFKTERVRERKTLYYGRRMMKHGHHQRLDASAHQHLSRHLRSCWSMWRLVSTSFLVRQTTTTIYLDCVGLWYQSYKVFRVLLEGFMSCDKNAFKCGSQSIKLVDFKVIPTVS